MSDDLIERLERVEGGDGGARWYRNPDGPEAAARIHELETDLAALRERTVREAADRAEEYALARGLRGIRAHVLALQDAHAPRQKEDAKYD